MNNFTRTAGAWMLMLLLVSVAVFAGRGLVAEEDASADVDRTI